MIDFYTTTLILGVIVALIGGSIGFKLISSRGKSMTSHIFNERLELVMDANKELKKSLAVAKGTASQMKEGITLPSDTNLDSLQQDGGFDTVIKGLISKYSMMAPPQLRPILQDPAIVGFLLEEAKKNPEQTKEVLKHFINVNGKIGTESGSEQSRESQLEANNSGA